MMVNEKAILSIVIPIYNEADITAALYDRLCSVSDRLQPNYQFEIVFVNDGSTDETLNRLFAIAEKDRRVKVVDLSRNFGKEIALTAGIDMSSGDAVIPLDADLQDPPEVIIDLVAKWREGYDVVFATRLARDGESWLKKATASAFYRTIGKLTTIDIPRDTGDFRLMTRQVVEALKTLREQNRFMKGLFSWVGFRQTAVYYKRSPRFAGKTKWNYWKLWNFAIEGITSFSYVPLEAATYIGFIVSVFSFAYGLFLLLRTLLFGNPIPGYSSTMVVILFLGGIQLFSLGIIGEYVGRIYGESKRRPLYFIRETRGFAEDSKRRIEPFEPVQSPEAESILQAELPVGR